MNNPLLEGRGLVKNYDDGRIQALRGVDVKIEAAEYVAISGPSGSGKSTLLHLLGGLDEPTHGEVLFKGSPLGSAVDLDGYRSRQVGFIFQAFYLLPTLARRRKCAGGDAGRESRRQPPRRAGRGAA